MLDTETKKRLDDARDILVGKIPDPKSQIEQITLALVYKFMNDMDDQSEAMGGERQFFIGDFAQYSWAKIITSGGNEMLRLYGEGITKTRENTNLPIFFRDVFKNAYLPYRDSQTLDAFLKIIHEFNYDHSENLGDAFEYLLLVMDSQGDAGQFRTPRHIIDFMVQIIHPQKHETILDPACGTAGFLIAAYKYIQNASLDEHGNTTLTPEEKGRMAKNFMGYDISPDMVRIASVNMYLHGFLNPQIKEYDTLTSATNWNEEADVILTNPPFMSPKGGIKPHSQFPIPSKRSEVLFVEYIYTHLTSTGRAAVIVPEGIIFQSQNAYKQLRKILVETYLVAVISLPAGVFNPYSGVKTSILVLDKQLARQTSNILFVKIENDGLSLGAQRKAIAQNDLPQAQKEIEEYFAYCSGAAEKAANFKPTLGLVVSKDKIRANLDYNLSGERYRENTRTTPTQWQMVRLGDVCERISETIDPTICTGSVIYIGLENIESNTGNLLGTFTSQYTDIKSTKNKFATNDILYGKLRPNLNKVHHANMSGICSTDIYVLRAKSNALSKYLEYSLRSHPFNAAVLNGLKGSQLPRISFEYMSQLQIPLPPLEVQQQIVAEIEGYQKIIAGARQVVDNWHPQIEIDPTWHKVRLGDVLLFVTSGATPLGGKETYLDSGILFIRSQNILKGRCDFSDAVFLSQETHKTMHRSVVNYEDVFLNITGASIGRSAVMTMKIEANVNQHVAILRCDREKLNPYYLSIYLNSEPMQIYIESNQSGGTRQALNYQQIRTMQIPLPPISIQQQIVAEIEEQRTIIQGNRQLIQIYQSKIQRVIDKVWQE